VGSGARKAPSDFGWKKGQRKRDEFIGIETQRKSGRGFCGGRRIGEGKQIPL